MISINPFYFIFLNNIIYKTMGKKNSKPKAPEGSITDF